LWRHCYNLNEGQQVSKGVSNFLHFIKQGYIKLIKSDSRILYIVTKIIYFNQTLMRRELFTSACLSVQSSKSDFIVIFFLSFYVITFNQNQRMVQKQFYKLPMTISTLFRIMLLNAATQWPQYNEMKEQGVILELFKVSQVIVYLGIQTFKNQLGQRCPILLLDIYLDSE